MNTFTLIGGDLRSVKLANLLQEDGNEVTTYGLEKAEDIKNNSKIYMENNLNDAIEKSNIIIAPLPFSQNGKDVMCMFSEKRIKITDLCEKYNEKIIFGGNISEDVMTNLESNYKVVYDLMKSETLTILNTISTAEGAINSIIQNTETIIQGSKILILGFGRVAKTLAHKLKALDAVITCAARKETDLAWIKTYGYNSLNINYLSDKIKNFDVIVNTVPSKIVGEDELRQIKEDVLLVDLASKPGGFDFETADRLKIKYVWALALPGKVAPLTSAQIIKNCIYETI